MTRNDGSAEIVVEEIETPGVHAVALDRVKGGTETRLAAVVLDPGEGRMARAAAGPLLAKLDLGERLTLLPGRLTPEGGDTGGGTELWPWLLALMALALMAESILGWWFGMRRR